MNQIYSYIILIQELNYKFQTLMEAWTHPESSSRSIQIIRSNNQVWWELKFYPVEGVELETLRLI
jgi:hypothetical protein